MSEIFDFYIDKRKTNPNDNFLDVILPFPIEANEKQNLAIKIVNFKYLNNVYNISQELGNNIFNFDKTPIIYDGTIGSEVNIDYSTEFYDTDYIALKSSVNTTYSVATNTQTIEGDNNRIFYIHNNIVSGTNSIKNIFLDGDNTRSIDNFVLPNNSFLFESKEGKKQKIITAFKMSITHNGNAITQAESFTLNIFGSDDNSNFTAIDKYSPNPPTDVDFAINSATGIDVIASTSGGGSNFRDLQNNISYKYYKVEITANNVITLANYKLTNLILKEKTYNYNTINVALTNTQIPTRIVRTIPDGIYKSSTFLQTINNLLLTNKLVLTLNASTNKLIITNSNTLASTTLVNSFKPTVDLGGFITSNPAISYGDAIYKIIIGNQNWKISYGIENESILLQTEIYNADKNINLTNFSKLLLTSSLCMKNSTQNELIEGQNNTDGIGDILLNIDNDYVPFSYIIYNNTQSLSSKLCNKIISNIRFNFYNDRSKSVYIDDCFIQFQIIKSKK